MSYSDYIVEAVWRKAHPVWGCSDTILRMDAYGNIISRWEYGNRNSKFGWEIDHIRPDGWDVLPNMQPLQWEANVRKRDSKTLADFLNDLA